MSKGLGKLQRECLRALTENEVMSVLEVAWFSYDVQADEHGRYNIAETQRAATARALLGLQRKGLAFAVSRTTRGGFDWARREIALERITRAANVLGNSGVKGYGKALIQAWAEIALPNNRG